MFDAVLNRHSAGPRQWGLGAFLTGGLHVVVVGAVIWAGLHAGRDNSNDAPEVTFFAPPPPPPPPPPPAGGGAPHAEKPKVEKKIIPKKDVIIDTKKEIPKEEPKEDPKPDAPPEPGGVAGGVAGGVIGGTVGGVVGGQIGGTVGGVLGGTLGGTGSGVVPFGEGMTRPSPLAGDEIQYTREAREAHISGVMIVKCTIQMDGSVSNCRVIKGIPMMDQQVLAALARHRGSPVMFQGHAVAVDYTYTIKLKFPD